MAANTAKGPTGKTLTGTDGFDDLKGASKADVLDGGAGDDKLRGAGGRDTLSGGDGIDDLIGGAGADLLTGGAGADDFFIDGVGDTFAELDQITDFTHDVDRLGFSDRIAITGSKFWAGVADSYDEALATAGRLITSDTADIVAVQLGADVVVFAGANLQDRVDGAVVLVGKSLQDIDQWDVF